MNTNETIERYFELNKEIKAMEREMNELKEQILEAMTTEETDTIWAGHIKAMTKTIKSSRFDSKAFKTDHEDLYEAYTKHGYQTRFTVNEIK